MARGFLATINKLAKEAARDAERSRRASEVALRSAAQRSEQARRAEERSIAQLERATAKERRRLEQEAQAAHLAARQALVDEKNAELEEIYEEIDTLLQATLAIDDFVDLESLKLPAEHPPFDREDLEKPRPRPSRPPEPPRPILRQPAEPTGLVGRLLGKRKHELAVADAKEAHEAALRRWEEAVKRLSSEYEAALEAHRLEEVGRIQALETAKTRYAKECAQREEDAARRIAEVDKLVSGLGYGVPEAVEEYVSIVLGNSVYPKHFPVEHQHTFDSSTAELKLTVVVPPPTAVPSIKEYKYSKSKDEISETSLSQKACKDRYSSAVHQVALRSLHEIFEADRRGLIQTVALTVGTTATDPATGKHRFIPFVGVGAEREAFLELDLSSVVPAATLKMLGASVSKNPHGLDAADLSGVRKS